MAGKKKKRKKKNRSVRIDADGQMHLFADKEAMKGRQRADRQGGSEGRSVQFCTGRPERILICSQSLEDFLTEREHSEAFRVSEFLHKQDWSLFVKKYKGGGRPPYDPAAMVGLILFGIMQGRSSLRELEALGQFDSRAWWLTGGLCPDHSKIGRFINEHGEALSQEFFESATRQVLAQAGGGKGDAAMDGTVVQAAASAYRNIKQEAARQRAAEARQQAEKDPQDEKAQQKAELAELVAETADRRVEARRKRGKDTSQTRVSPTEPEAAVLRHKNRSVSPAYKPSVLADENRIILAHAVHPTSEAKVVGGMLDQAKRAGAKIRRVLADGLYYDSEVLAACKEKGKQLVCPPRKDKKTGLFPKSMFCYNRWTDRWLCPGGHEMAPVNRTRNRDKGMVTYGKAPCGECPHRKLCTKNQKGRQITRYEDDGDKEALCRFMKTEEAKERYGHRAGMVEPVYSTLKDRQGLRRFRRRGLEKVRLEFALHAIAYNLKRYLVFTAPGAASGNDPLSEVGDAVCRLFLRLTAIFPWPARPRLAAYSS